MTVSPGRPWNRWSRRHGAAALAILAAVVLHAGVLLQTAWSGRGGRPLAGAGPARILHLRLDIEPAPAVPVGGSTTAVAGRTDRHVAPSKRWPERAAGDASPAAANTAAEVAPGGAPLTDPAPLDLRLRRPPPGRPAEARSARGQALDDPRSNSRAPASERFAEQVAGVAGTMQESMADGSLRIRSGTNCVIALPSRAGTLDPFNGAIQPSPRLVESCR